MLTKNKIKTLTATILILSLLGFSLMPKDEELRVKTAISPTKIEFENENHLSISDIQTFDSDFSQKNKTLAQKFGITEEEAFVIGNLAKYWAQNLLNGRDIILEKEDLIYYKYSYRQKLANSAFGIQKDKPTNQVAFDKLLKSVRHTKYGIYKNDKIYPIAKEYANGDYLIIRKSHFYKLFPKYIQTKISRSKQQPTCFAPFVGENIKIIFSDFTTKLKPDRNCSSDICKEILTNINSAQSTIDMAIYGYSSTPAIEKAIKNAQARGVKIRLIYDVDSKNQNIYPDTFKFVSLIANSQNDGGLKDSNATMHNKFYIFDNKTVISGSANLSHTDMSGFNFNNIIVINSKTVAEIYKSEFEQMYAGKFHSAKNISERNEADGFKIYFSPQDKALTNGILPVIREAKTYIYIPIFVITENRVVEELINAKKRGVDVRLISDALNASKKYSKIQILRDAKIPVKVENYAGKMHAKTLIADDKYVVIGSMNLSKSGETKNDENTIVMTNADAAKYLKKVFLYEWDRIPNKWLTGYPRAEGWESIGSCDDGIDNDYDGLIDREDNGCTKPKVNNPLAHLN